MLQLPDDDQLPARARNYQVEMLEESLKKNIIVAVSVWTGKHSKQSKQASRQPDSQTVRESDSQTVRQSDRQTDRQTDNLRRLDSDSYPADGHRFWEDPHVRTRFSFHLHTKRITPPPQCRARTVVATAEEVWAVADMPYTAPYCESVPS